MKKVKILKQNKNERLLGTLILRYLAKYIVNCISPTTLKALKPKDPKT